MSGVPEVNQHTFIFQLKATDKPVSIAATYDMFATPQTSSKYLPEWNQTHQQIKLYSSERPHALFKVKLIKIRRNTTNPDHARDLNQGGSRCRKTAL